MTEGQMPGRRRGKRLGQLMVNGIRSVTLICIYYTCSIGLTFYQKNLFRDFRFPLTVVIVHLFMKFMLAGICRLSYTITTGQPRILLPWEVYWKKVLPPGAAAGIDIGLSQWSLEFITVAFGLRWTLSQLVMQKTELGLTNPIDMVYHIQPWMAASLLPLAVFMEGNALAASKFGFRFKDLGDAGFMWLRVVFGAVLAFFMEVSEYLVISYTSSLTFSISGVAKEIMTLSLAVYYYNEHLSTINQMGLVLCILGIIVHVMLKAKTLHPTKATHSSNSFSTSSPTDSLQKVPLLSESEGEYELFNE
ncbi:solute carrier family 35 member C2 isoform X3 [Oratosquilla oratoria]|uniref:solute carrier family 35 member C2 isoform X3 n=1 Tax=Oratosquilla oratoria TaxID=337810 RepID=UPI003F76FC06